MPDAKSKEARPAIVEATRWVGEDWNDRNEDSRHFDWDFRARGALAYDSPTGHWENGSWECDGATLLIETNDHYADYIGYLRPGYVKGSASNVNGLEWFWWARLE